MMISSRTSFVLTFVSSSTECCLIKRHQAAGRSPTRDQGRLPVESRRGLERIVPGATVTWKALPDLCGSGPTRDARRASSRSRAVARADAEGRPGEARMAALGGVGGLLRF